MGRDQTPRKGLLAFTLRHRWVLAACTILMIPALQDVTGLTRISARYENTIDATFAVFSVLVVAGLIQKWTLDRQRERDEDRYKHISKLVFRGLSQAINDAHRVQLAPTIGKDLEKFGIPSPQTPSASAWQTALAEMHIDQLDDPNSGFWHEQYRPLLEKRLQNFVHNPLFVEAIFESTAFARRSLQTAFTDAAAIAQAIPLAAERLSSVADVADAIVQSQEAWRTAMVHGVSDASAIISAYLASIDATNATLMNLQTSADLPAGRVDVPQQAIKAGNHAVR